MSSFHIHMIDIPATSLATYHDCCMILTRLWEPSDGDIAVSNRFHFEHPSSLGNLVKLVIDRLQQHKHLRRLSHATPRCKADQIRKEYGHFRKQICNRLGLENGVCQTIRGIIQESLKLSFGRLSESLACIALLLSTRLFIRFRHHSITNVLGEETGHNGLCTLSSVLQLGLSAKDHPVIQGKDTRRDKEGQDNHGCEYRRSIGIVGAFKGWSGDDSQGKLTMGSGCIVTIVPRALRKRKGLDQTFIFGVMQIASSEILCLMAVDLVCESRSTRALDFDENSIDT